MVTSMTDRYVITRHLSPYRRDVFRHRGASLACEVMTSIVPIHAHGDGSGATRLTWLE